MSTLSVTFAVDCCLAVVVADCLVVPAIVTVLGNGFVVAAVDCCWLAVVVADCLVPAIVTVLADGFDAFVVAACGLVVTACVVGELSSLNAADPTWTQNVLFTCTTVHLIKNVVN